MRTFYLLFCLFIILIQQSNSQTSFYSAQNSQTLEMFRKMQKADYNWILSPLGLKMASRICDLSNAEKKGIYLDSLFGIDYIQQQDSFSPFYKLPEKFIEQLEPVGISLDDLSEQKKLNAKLEITNAMWYPIDSNIDNNGNKIIIQDSSIIVKLFPFSRDGISKSIEEMNRWLVEKSQFLIDTSLLTSEQITQDTGIINLSYLLANWMCSFDNRYVENRKFYLENGKKAKVSMMYQRNIYDYYENHELQALSLPYQTKQLSMLLLLPKMKQKVLDIDLDYMTHIYKSMKTQRSVEVDLYLPRFSITSIVNNSDSSFKNIQTISPPTSCQILHVSFVNIDEGDAHLIRRIYAIGATKPLKNITFNANHTFYFFIIDNTSDLILFIGKYAGK